jgi:hypothetical protein
MVPPHKMFMNGSQKRVMHASERERTGEWVKTPVDYDISNNQKCQIARNARVEKSE